MHGDPGRSWQLGELAKAAAMSRATFALYFKTVAGIAPMSAIANSEVAHPTGFERVAFAFGEQGPTSRAVHCRRKLKDWPVFG
jgi:hypothetical protein